MARQFYFAWVDAGEAFDPDVHNREDEDVFAFSYSHGEGDVAGMEITVRNPRIGFLNPGRKRWAYFSHNRGSDASPDVVPVFFGRLLGIPTNVFDTLVTLNFTARPTDFVDQKAALAESMKVLPYYDPIFVSPDRWADPDVVLEGYSVLWHVHPVTHVVTVSDILVPEDGEIDLSSVDIFYDSMSMTLNQVPLTSVTVEATIPWTQIHSQQINLRFKVFEAGDVFHDEQYGYLIQSYTMDGLIQDWPKTGANIGSGWTVALGELTDVSVSHTKIEQIPEIFRTDDVPVLPEGSIFYPVKTTGKYWGGVDGAGYDFQYELVAVSLGYAVPFLWVEADRNQDFGQVVSFTLTADMQDIATAAEEDEKLLITLSANRVSDLTEDDSLPFGNVAKRDYLSTDRGQQSLQHLICIARASLKMRGRAVQIGFEMAFADAFDLDFTLRKSATIADPRLPGGTATGKIIGIRHSLDGDEGAAITQITIGCAVGYGGVRTAVPGDPVYADDDYVEDDYQVRENETVLLDTSDVTYTIPLVEPGDDGIDFEKGLSPDVIVKQFFVTDGPAEQKALLEADKSNDQAQVSELLQNNPTQFHLELIDLKKGPFVWPVPVTVSTLVLPKQIDLEAPSVG
jgi:hypothetical protein